MRMCAPAAELEFEETARLNNHKKRLRDEELRL
jgi:hypothetical protein